MYNIKHLNLKVLFVATEPVLEIYPERAESAKWAIQFEDSSFYVLYNELFVGRILLTRTLLHRCKSRLLADYREMRRRLILYKIGFTRQRFFTSYFIDGRVFFRIFTFFVSELI